jgi:hypothetical protein
MTKILSYLLRRGEGGWPNESTGPSTNTMRNAPSLGFCSVPWRSAGTKRKSECRSVVYDVLSAHSA